MTQRGIKKRKRGLFLVKGRERELGGRYPLAGLCPAFMCFKKKKKKQKGEGKNADAQISVSKQKSGAG